MCRLRGVSTFLLVSIAATLATDVQRREVHLYSMLCPGIDLPARTIATGLSVASDIFRDAQIDLKWHYVSHSPHAGDIPGDANVILIAPARAPKDARERALARTSPYTNPVQILIFTDRFDGYLVNVPITAGALLGHVLAHEIGHALERNGLHSRRGLMKETWSFAEIAAMPLHRMRFDPIDRESIRRALTPPAGNVATGLLARGGGMEPVPNPPEDNGGER